MAEDRLLRQFAQAVAEHAYALARRRMALETGARDLAEWDAKVADAEARRAEARHSLMLHVISADHRGSRRWARA